MIQVAVTQRVDIIESYGERRDALDQAWTDFLLGVGITPLLIPNNPDYARQMDVSGLSGLLLTGGNTLAKYGGNAPERDQTETVLLKNAIEHSIPVIGVCRGMQLIQDYFGISLQPINGHVATRHSLETANTSKFSDLLGSFDTVNAYHDFGTQESVEELQIVAHTASGIVMAVEHDTLPIFGQMWHSERESPYSPIDQQLFRRIFA